jgi:hypothetical protein
VCLLGTATTGRGVGWSMCCVSDMVPGEEGAAVRVSVWARADRLLRHPLLTSPRKNCQLGKVWLAARDHEPFCW